MNDAFLSLTCALREGERKKYLQILLLLFIITQSIQIDLVLSDLPVEVLDQDLLHQHQPELAS